MPRKKELTTTLPDNAPLHELVFHRVAYPTVFLAQEFGLFNMLEHKPATIDEIGSSLKLIPRAAEGMVAVAASLGFLQHVENGLFELSESGRAYLLTSSPYYSGALLKHPETRWSENHVIDQLRHSFRKGDDPNVPLAVVMEQLPAEEVRGFIGLMHTMTLPAVVNLSKQPIFKNIHRLLDVGGGSGSLSIGIAANHSQVQCTVLDLAPVCKIIEENIAVYHLSDRVSTHAADMFNGSWPAGFDAVLFANIFHDWDRDSCRKLARHAFESLEPGGTILLHEILLNENKDGPLIAACYSVMMLIHERGKQYTLSEFKEILSEAGFVDVKFSPLQGHYQLISARKPS